MDLVFGPHSREQAMARSENLCPRKDLEDYEWRRVRNPDRISFYDDGDDFAYSSDLELLARVDGDFVMTVLPRDSRLFRLVDGLFERKKFVKGKERRVSDDFSVYVSQELEDRVFEYFC